ncbi:MAG: sensor histidine kinase [Lachnospiraceae bacterium]|nr:sensor histidine kinase [Lachnospiraceae bacterium]
MEKNGNKKVLYPIRYKLLTLILVALLPLLIITVYLIYSLLNYSRAYEGIVGNMTIANNYNIFFKEDMDESLYKLVVGYVSFDNIDMDDSLKDPYVMINEARRDLGALMNETDSESRSWLRSLLRNLDSLEGKVNEIKENLQGEDKYGENMTMLDEDIYILTDLIQEDLQYFIYYQTRSIERIQENLKLRLLRFIIFWAVLSSLIVIFVVLTAVSIVKGITKPIKELCEVTEKIAGGDFASKANIDTDDELMTLSESVNDMSEHLEIMVDTIKKDEAKMHHAELRLLQEQINPHFLYNTLDTIIWLIESNKPDAAINVVVSLSTFFRQVLSQGREIITVREEEQHIRSYLDIQQVRYADILDYEIDIDNSIYDYAILKMTLQPLVENSLYHGIKYKRAKGTIRVTGQKENGNIVFHISDDGVGMDPETLNKLRVEITRRCKDTATGFGLANVSERIRMHFGNEYGMQIDSTKDVGTDIKITIPAMSITDALEDKDET